MKKRIVSILLCLCMVIALLPTAALAGDMLAFEDYAEGVVYPWTPTATGAGRLTYSVDDSDALTITIVNSGGVSLGGNDRWDCSLVYPGLSMETGCTYTLSYQIYSSNAGKYYTKIGNASRETVGSAVNGEVWHNNNGTVSITSDRRGTITSTNIDYNAGWDRQAIQAGETLTVTVTFSPTETMANAQWVFEFGGDGENTQGACFPDGTVLKFSKLSLTNNTNNNADYNAPQPPALNPLGYYEIGSADDLSWFAGQVNSGKTSINGVLTADIVMNTGDLSGYNGTDANAWRVWTPIGNSSYAYSGTFDGAGHTVSGLYSYSTSYVGVFGSTSSGSMIKNLGVMNSYFKGSDSISGICGDNSGTIENCYNTGTVSGTENFGGVCGYNNGGSITNCYYLDTCVSGGNSLGTAKSAAQFASGEVCWFLNGGTTDGTQKWYQTLGTDTAPKYAGSTVYYDESANPQYSNEAAGESISVSVTWGAMEFTYSDGTWNPSTHEYAGGGWTPNTADGNKITVQNNGTEEVSVSYSYAQTNTDVTGSFSDGTNAITTAVALPVGGTKNAYLILTGKPADSLNSATLGAVTVSLGTGLGFVEIGEDTYYRNTDGSFATGWVEHPNTGDWYYFGTDGKMYRSTWLQDGSYSYYVGQDGTMQTGLTVIVGETYYFKESTSNKGAMQTGWVLTGGDWYYFNASGVMLHDTTVDGYVLGSDGKWIKS